MPTQKIELTSWNRFLTRGLGIVPQLLGRSHTFDFNGWVVKVQLPSKKRLELDETRRDYDSRVVSLGSYREVDGKKIPIECSVHVVDLTIVVKEWAVVPEEALSSPNLTYKGYTEEQKNYLQNLAAKYEKIAEQAFDVWIRTLRWKSGQGHIARPEVHGSSSGWSTYLYQRATKQRVAASSMMITVTMFSPVTVEHWNDTRKALKAGKTPPVYIELLFDAVEHRGLGDLQRAVVDAAVSCESYMRQVVANSLPSHLNASLRRFIDEANVRQIIEKFFPELLGEDELKEYKKLKSTLHQLFELRNGILHSGKVETLSDAECSKHINCVRQVIALPTKKPSK